MSALPRKADIPKHNDRRPSPYRQLSWSYFSALAPSRLGELGFILPIEKLTRTAQVGALMSAEICSASDFYERHPISCEIILARLKASRGHLDHISPEELFPHDQDHYGGLDANDALAARAGISKGTKVVDFCAGLGGPARYLAHRYGADVTGIELTPARVKGAQELTRLVSLQNNVRVIEGDVMQVPLPDDNADVVISQEALLHIPDKSRALVEAYRILKPGGRIAFTDWVAHRPLSDADKGLMWRGMAVTDLYSLENYSELVRKAGFSVPIGVSFSSNGLQCTESFARRHNKPAHRPVMMRFMKATFALSNW